MSKFISYYSAEKCKAKPYDTNHRLMYEIIGLEMIENELRFYIETETFDRRNANFMSMKRKRLIVKTETFLYRNAS